MDLEARRAELEQMMQDQFLASPEAWKEGWKLLASLYEEGEVYASTMAGKVLAHNTPKGSTPPGEIVVFKEVWRACRAIQHEEEGHPFRIDGQCSRCFAKIADTKTISEQARMVYVAKEKIRDEKQKRSVDGH